MRSYVLPGHGVVEQGDFRKLPNGILVFRLESGMSGIRKVRGGRCTMSHMRRTVEGGICRSGRTFYVLVVVPLEETMMSQVVAGSSTNLVFGALFADLIKIVTEDK